MLKRAHLTIWALGAMALPAAMPVAARATPPPQTYLNGSLIAAVPPAHTNDHLVFVQGSALTFQLQLEGSGQEPLTCAFLAQTYLWDPAGENPRTEVVVFGTGACQDPALEQSLHDSGILPPGTSLVIYASSSMPAGSSISSSLPWKGEMFRAYNQLYDEEVVMWRIGLHDFGEDADAETKTGKCYPGSEEFEAPGTEGCVKINVILPQVGYEFVYHGTTEGEFINGVGNGLTPSKVEFHPPPEEIPSGFLVSEHEEVGLASLSGLTKFGPAFLIDER
jgi:hypothetical protein